MQCPSKNGEGSEMFVAYAARTLAPDTEAALERHLPGCPECRAAAAAQRTVWDALDSWDPRAISPDFDARLYARISLDEARPWYRRLFGLGPWHLRPAMPVAAACAALLAALLIKGPLPGHKPAISAQQKRVDIEQVERALDDIDMLKQLGVAPAGNPGERPQSL